MPDPPRPTSLYDFSDVPEQPVATASTEPTGVRKYAPMAVRGAAGFFGATPWTGAASGLVGETLAEMIEKGTIDPSQLDLKRIAAETAVGAAGGGLIKSLKGASSIAQAAMRGGLLSGAAPIIRHTIEKGDPNPLNYPGEVATSAITGGVIGGAAHAVIPKLMEGYEHLRGGESTPASAAPIVEPQVVGPHSVLNTPRSNTPAGLRLAADKAKNPSTPLRPEEHFAIAENVGRGTPGKGATKGTIAKEIFGPSGTPPPDSAVDIAKAAQEGDAIRLDTQMANAKQMALNEQAKEKFGSDQAAALEKQEREMVKAAEAAFKENAARDKIVADTATLKGMDAVETPPTVRTSSSIETPTGKKSSSTVLKAPKQEINEDGDLDTPGNYAEEIVPTGPKGPTPTGMSKSTTSSLKKDPNFYERLRVAGEPIVFDSQEAGMTAARRLGTSLEQVGEKYRLVPDPRGKGPTAPATPGSTMETMVTEAQPSGKVHKTWAQAQGEAKKLGGTVEKVDGGYLAKPKGPDMPPEGPAPAPVAPIKPTGGPSPAGAAEGPVDNAGRPLGGVSAGVDYLDRRGANRVNTPNADAEGIAARIQEKLVNGEALGTPGLRDAAAQTTDLNASREAAAETPPPDPSQSIIPMEALKRTPAEVAGQHYGAIKDERAALPPGEAPRGSPLWKAERIAGTAAQRTKFEADAAAATAANATSRPERIDPQVEAAQTDLADPAIPEHIKAGIRDWLSSKGESNPMVMARVGLGLGGALTGAAVDKDDPIEGAILGGTAGAMAPSLVEKLDTNPESGMLQALLKRLPNMYRSGLLSEPKSLGYNAIAGPLGSQFFGGLEQTLKGVAHGNPEQTAMGGNILKDVASPLKWGKGYLNALAEAEQKLRESEMGRAGFDAIGNETYADKVIQIPATLMTGGDVNVKTQLRDRGMPEDLAEETTLTAEPKRALWRNIANFGKTTTENKHGSAIANMLLPFKRTAANIMESGTERTPILGSVISALGDPELKTPWTDQFVQQGIGGAVFGTSFALGYNTPTSTAKDYKILNLVSNLGGQYALLSGAGFAAGQAKRMGKSAAAAVTAKYLGEIPLPETTAINELLKPFVKIADGESIDLKDIPRSAVPKIYTWTKDHMKSAATPDAAPPSSYDFTTP